MKKFIIPWGKRRHNIKTNFKAVRCGVKWIQVAQAQCILQFENRESLKRLDNLICLSLVNAVTLLGYDAV